MSSTTIRHCGVPENTHSVTTTASWRIGEKPYDPLDPGPYGTPGWRPDPRRGRHRRAELPDPPPGQRRDSESAAPRNSVPADSPSLSPMQEAAYRDFLRDSEELHLAHLEPPEPNRVLVYLRFYLRVVIAILYWRVIPFPEPPSRCRRSRAACELRQATRFVGRAAVPQEVAADPVATLPIQVEWRTPAAPPVRRSDPPRTRPVAEPRPVAQPQRAARPQTAGRRRPAARPRAVLTPRNAELSRKRADTRLIFHHTYGIARDQNFRNLHWPKGSWEHYEPLDGYPPYHRRGVIKRRNNRRPRNLALPRSFPSTIPAVPIGWTNRPAPVGPSKRLVLASATPYPGGDFR